MLTKAASLYFSKLQANMPIFTPHPLSSSLSSSLLCIHFKFTHLDWITLRLGKLLLLFSFILSAALRRLLEWSQFYAVLLLFRYIRLVYERFRTYFIGREEKMQPKRQNTPGTCVKIDEFTHKTQMERIRSWVINMKWQYQQNIVNLLPDSQFAKLVFCNFHMEICPQWLNLQHKMYACNQLNVLRVGCNFSFIFVLRPSI